MNRFLKSRRIYMLFLLPFVVAAIDFISGSYPGHLGVVVPPDNCIGTDFLESWPEVWRWGAGQVLLLAVAYLIFFVNDRFKLLQQTTTLPALLFVLLFPMAMGAGVWPLLSLFLLVLALGRLLAAIEEVKNNYPVFDFGVLVSLSVLFCPKYILLPAWSLAVILLTGRSTLKDVTALFYGLFLPVLFLAFTYFWRGRLAELPSVFWEQVTSGGSALRPALVEWIRMGVLFLLLVLSVFTFLTQYSSQMVSQRRGIVALLSLLVFAVLGMFAVPGSFGLSSALAVVPLSFLYALYFLMQRVSFVGNLMFLLLLYVSLFGYWV